MAQEPEKTETETAAEPVSAEPAPEVPAENPPEAVPAEPVPEIPAENPTEAVPAEPVPEVPAENPPEAVPAEPVPEIPAENPPEAVPAEPVPEIPAENQPDDDEYTAKDFLHDALDLISSLMIVSFCAILLFAYVICLVDVEGGSMVPTLSDGDRLLVSRLGSSYETGDILILDSKISYTFGKNDTLIQGAGLGKRIVKRLIAKGGQEINIDFAAGAVYVDGEKLDEPYINALTKRDEGGFSYPFRVPEGYVFVMGDNRNVSKDSRHPEVGLLSEEDVVGKVILRVLPFAQFGGVE